MKKLLAFCSVFVLSLFLSLVIVSAFSMSPGIYRYEYDESKGIKEDVTFTVRSSSPQAIVLDVVGGGPLGQYISFDNSSIELEPGQAKSLRISIDIPPGLDEVGSQDATVTFTKRIRDAQGGFMVVTTALRARIAVTFAYPGEYIVITELSPVNVNQGQDTVVKWEVQARGMDTTSFVNELTIFDVGGDVVFSKTFSRMFLERNQKYSESTSVSSGSFVPGNYNVSLKSVSGGNSDELFKILRIGQEDIDLIRFLPVNYTSTELTEFSFIVENLWNGVFSNVYGVLEFGDISITTKSGTLSSFGRLTIDKQYIDLRSLGEGTHNGTLTVFFDGRSKSFDVSVTAVLPVSERNNSYVILISILIFVLIIVGILLVVLFKKSNKRVL